MTEAGGAMKFRNDANGMCTSIKVEHSIGKTEIGGSIVSLMQDGKQPREITRSTIKKKAEEMCRTYGLFKNWPTVKLAEDDRKRVEFLIDMLFPEFLEE
jgi:hypothetical protein